METPLIMQIVGEKLDELQSLRDKLTDLAGSEPSLNLRLEIVVAGEFVTITINDSQVVVRDEKANRVIATGDYELARLALAGMQAQQPPTG